MPCRPGSITVIPDPTGDTALVYLPARGENGEELRFYAAHAERVDAAFAVALRACVEHFENYVRIPVRLIEEPADETVRRTLAALLGPEIPDSFGLGSAGAAPRTVILPAQRIGSYERADELTDVIVDPLGSAYGTKVMRYTASAFGLLVENGLDHARDSSVDVIAAIAYDRHSDEVRLAVTDTGESMSRGGDAGEALREALARSRELDGGLEDLIALARSGGLDVSVTLATGDARASLRDGDWVFSSAESIDGFTAIVSVKAH